MLNILRTGLVWFAKSKRRCLTSRNVVNECISIAQGPLSICQSIPRNYASWTLSSSFGVSLGMSANRGAPLAASKFLELVFLNSVCGLDLRKCISNVSLVLISGAATYFFMTCLLRNALSFCVAGDIISSEGETYCAGLSPRLEKCVARMQL